MLDASTVAEVVNAMNRVGLMVDQRQWESLETEAFADRVHVDYTSLVGGDPQDNISPADLIAGWRAALGPLKSTQHLVGSHRVTFDDAGEAMVFSTFIATHVAHQAPGGTMWTLGGDYEHRLRRIEGQWRVTSIKMMAKWSTGNDALLQEVGGLAAATAPSRLNLQNTPAREGVERLDVTFKSGAATLVGHLYRPRGSSGPLQAVIVTGAWTSVKEQMSGTYARELAARGFAALAFDFAGWGQSEGDHRFEEDPARKTADILAAADFMTGRDDIDPKNISGLGICASSGYMAEAVSKSDKLRKLALVAAWLHDEELVEQVYGGAETVKSLVEASRAAEKEAQPLVLVAASTTDNTSPMFQAPYYTESDRGLIPEYDNKFSITTWEPWLSYDGLASAASLTKPVLMVCSDAAALPAGARRYTERTKAPVTELWLDDVYQFDFYDREDVVLKVSDAIAAHLSKPE